MTYKAITMRNIEREPEWSKIPKELQEAIRVVSQVFPFRVSVHVLTHLINWHDLPGDPMFQLAFPQREMLNLRQYTKVKQLLESGSKEKLDEYIHQIRLNLNPHPAGQMTHNTPSLKGKSLDGIQHKYRETALFFPAKGQTCHTYCTYCFRWPQFVQMPGCKIATKQTDGLIAYLREHEEITDVLFTGGDPMTMNSDSLWKCIGSLLAPGLEHIQNIRIGTKAIAWWPYRFVGDEEAHRCLELFKYVVRSGKHLAIMAHFSHPAELRPSIANCAIKNILSTGAQIRMQAPFCKHVNDDPKIWAHLWQKGVRLGMIPYYAFVERDTGPKRYFELPLARCYKIFREAYNQVSGLARTVRGPSMSAFPGKVQVCGITKVGDEKVFVLNFIQGRDPKWVGKPFFAKFNPRATWLNHLEPAFGEEKFFFEK